MEVVAEHHKVALRAFRAGKGRRRWLDAIRSSKDPTVFTVLFEDTAALLGLLIAAAGIAAGQMFNLPIADGMGSVVIGLLLAVTAAFLAYESQSLLTGEGVTRRSERACGVWRKPSPAFCG